jgi:hypothetical protein
MRIPRGMLFAIIAMQVLALSATAAFGWELEMGGSFNWTYEWYGQQGAQGFFGRYDVDNGPGITANLNFWNGGQFDTNIASGANAGWSYFNVEIEPEIRVNGAVSLYAKYRVAHYGDAAAANYHTEEAPGTDDAISAGQWTMFWTAIETPWGTLGFGKRPWEFGTAFQYDGSDALTTESILITAPYGPLRIGFGFYPYRFAGSSPLGYGDPFDLEIPEYYSRADFSGSLLSDVMAFLVYSSGPLEMGITAVYGDYHIGPEAQLLAAPADFQRVALDSDYFHGAAYMKYDNGRFFFNSELAWLYWTDRYSDPDDVVDDPNTRYIEQLRYMVETGLVAGPARISLLHAWTPGPDRRDGELIGRQSAAFVRHPTYDSHLANFSVWRPYSYLLGYNYGSGLGAYDLSGNGYILDACVYAARLDYAVACNLNLSAGFLWAERTSKGYGWGCIGFEFDPDAVPSPPTGNIATDVNGAAGSPNIPDTALGYEIHVAADWQLLEGWVFSTVFSYWRPGKWFNYACIDRSVPGWDVPAAGNNFGTRPDRTIDPVIGGEFSMSVEF